MRHARGEQGSTIIESIVAAALFATTAAVVFPMFSDVKRISKQGDARKLCQEVVRAKLDEYRFGKATNPTWAANPSGAGAGPAPEYAQEPLSADARNQLANLTVPARTATQVTTAGVAMSTNGFTYAKVRYNRYYPTACNGTSFATRLTGIPAALPATDVRRQLGMRECVGSSRAWLDTATAAEPLSPKCPGAPTSPDRLVAEEIPGFKLYVKLERVTPWLLPNRLPAASAQFDPACPNFGGRDDALGVFSPAGGFNTAPASSMYDFNANGDGIRISVTGVMDTQSANASLTDFAGLHGSRWDDFVCAAQSTVYPETYPVRYYLSTDGRIYPVQGSATNGATDETLATTRWILPSLYSQAAAFRSSGITSFAVHPLNAAVYVLRPGSLTRYGNCGGSVLDCSVNSAAMNGVSDAGQAGWADVQEFQINSNIRYIGVDFLTGRIYGVLGDRSAVLQINISCLNPLTATATCSSPAAAITYSTLNPGTFPVPTILASEVAGRTGMSTSGRLSGFFVAPGGDDAFVSDYSSSASAAATSYSSSIYRATDLNLSWPIARLPVAALTFSK